MMVSSIRRIIGDMEVPTREAFAEMIKAARISKRLVRDIRYVPEEVTYPELRDFLAVTNKAGSEGVLLYETQVISFVLQRRQANKNGRIEAIICDICASWQRGTNSAILTLQQSSKKNVSHLVCADLNCSLHVRDLTDASKLSRTQLRENISAETRVMRLHERIERILSGL